MSLFAAAVVAVLAVGECGHEKPVESSCPNVTPASCPADAPTYVGDVAPILAERCGLCHTAGGMESVRAFDTYEQVYAQRTRILTRVHACLMPPPDQMQPTAEERRAILTWVVCGAQPNGCPDDTPTGCPAAPPHFAADVAPVISGHCVKCHAPGAKAARFPMQTYDQIFTLAGDIALQLATCAMPPPTETALTATERSNLLDWLACGALDN